MVKFCTEVWSLLKKTASISPSPSGTFSAIFHKRSKFIAFDSGERKKFLTCGIKNEAIFTVELGRTDIKSAYRARGDKRFKKQFKITIPFSRIDSIRGANCSFFWTIRVFCHIFVVYQEFSISIS